MKQQLQILIVEDDPEHRNVLREEIEDDPDIENYNLEFAESFDEVKKIWANNFASCPPDIAILDHRLSGSGDGADVAKWLLEKTPSLRIIVNTAYPNQDVDGKEAFRVYCGLPNTAFLEKKTKTRLTNGSVESIPVWDQIRPLLLEQIKLVRGEMSASLQDLCTKLCAHSESFKRCLESVGKTMTTDSNVLITGESGVGKEKIAMAIHSLSNRRKGRMVTINCGALPDPLLESELFGYIKGAFTDAKKDKPGRLAIAEGGTVFLDEIGDISQVFQVKLLRVLEDKVYEPLGSNKSLKANVRIVAATNKNLEQMVKERSFREDLYYRLNVLPVHIPPLRERKEDIIPLAKHFIGIQSKKNEGKYSKHFLNGSAETLLTEYPWLGNIRELRNIIEKTLLKVGPERQQIAPTDIMLQTDINDCEQSTSQKLKNDKTISIQKDTENTKNIIGEEKSRFSEIDKNQLMQLCRKIWDTKGNIIDNNVDNVPNQLTFLHGRSDLYICAILAIFYVAYLENKKAFRGITLDKIFFKGRKTNNYLKQYLQNKSKHNKSLYYPIKDGFSTYGTKSHLQEDGYLLKRNGMDLYVGGS